jgi:hypothetical protein
MAGETARILVEFLEVAITSIVFLKGVYPSGQFLFKPFSLPLSLIGCQENYIYASK